MNERSRPTLELDETLLQCLQRIRGVQAASIIRDVNGQVSEVHLVGSISRRAKQIVRDVESLLHAQFGIPIDYRKISLVQLDSEAVSSHRSRLRLIQVAQPTVTDHQVRVLLQSDDRRFEGAAFVIDAPSDNAMAQAAAEATLSAVAAAIGHSVPLDIHNVQLLASEGQRVCLAIVIAVTPHGEERLTGSCLVAQNVIEAGCKATLDALNRRLPVWSAESRNITASGVVGART